jgi:hypothetical protein
LILVVALSCGVAQVAAQPERQRAATTRTLDEKALSAQAAQSRPGPVIRGNATVLQGQLTTNDPVFNRPIENCAALSAVGTAVHYHVQAFTVDTSGDYAIIGVQEDAGIAWDGFIYVFSAPFDPSAPLANCIAANDDDVGPGTSRIEPIGLQANSGYVLVTAGFGNDDVGSFTNTINGPGAAQVLGTDLAISLSGPNEIPLQGTIDFAVTLSNLSAAPLDVLAELSFPSTLSFVGSTCGGGLVGAGTWSAPISALPAGAANARQCVVSLRANSAQCTTVSISALASSPGQVTAQAEFSNNRELVADPSFEATDAAFDSPAWTEASDNFGSPLCDVATCGTGLGSGPRTGRLWVWFGGSDVLESGSIEQAIAITEEATALRFFTEYPVCDTSSGASEFLRVTVDGTEVWRVDATSPRCNTVGYQEEIVPLAAYADGQSHTLRFESVSGTAGAVSNFFMDDISIESGAQCGVPAGISNPPQEVPLGNTWTLALLALVLALSGVATGRRLAPR